MFMAPTSVTWSSFPNSHSTLVHSCNRAFDSIAFHFDFQAYEVSSRQTCDINKKNDTNTKGERTHTQRETLLFIVQI